jgi:hypothetical protein
VVWPNKRPRAITPSGKRRAEWVPAQGFECGDPARIDQASQTYTSPPVPKTPDEARSTGDSDVFGPTIGPADPVEGALAQALDAAAAAGRFDVVAQLAEELRARRLASAGNVVELPTDRRRPR